MGFRYQRRLNLGRGFGLNLSKSGIGVSRRGRYGSLGSRGFSVRTGIPGLGYRQAWGRGTGSAGTFLALAAVVASVLIAVLWIAAWAVCALAALIDWVRLTLTDYLEYRRVGGMPAPAEETPPAEREGLPSMWSFALAIALMIVAFRMFALTPSSQPAQVKFTTAEMQNWHAVMRDADQPPSTRLSNARALIQNFPGTDASREAAEMEPGLAGAAAIASAAAATAAAQYAAQKQVLADRKARREEPPASALATTAKAEPRPASALSMPRSEAKAQASPVRSNSVVTDDDCPCSSSRNCFGPRGGRYCITSGGNKRYR